ncbi:hypothetical protein P3T40_006538, partial [Paraburkholderia sp. EB58]
MTVHSLSVLEWLLVGFCCAATVYAGVAAVAMPFFSKRAGVCHVGWTSVSVLKPLCGIEPRL